MTELLRAIADVAREGGIFTLIIGAFLLAGLGERVTNALAGRRRAAVKAAELKTVKRENAQLHDLLRHYGDGRALDDAAQSGDVARLVAQARDALSDRAELLSVVDRVQASDQAYPQLPQEVRDAVDSALARHRQPMFITEVKRDT